MTDTTAATPDPLSADGAPDPLRTEYVPLEALKANARNPKSHDIQLIDSSISRFGIVDRITVDERTGTLISGHGRARALREMRDRGEAPPAGIKLGAGGAWLVPVNTGWASKDDVEAAAALIAMNRTTEVGGWVDESLLELLDSISESDDGLDGVGFSETDLDDLHALLEAIEPEALLELDGEEAPKAKKAKAPKPDLDEAGAHGKGSGGGAMVKITLMDAGAIDAWHTYRDARKTDDDAMRELLGLEPVKKAKEPKAPRKRGDAAEPTMDDLADEGIELPADTRPIPADAEEAVGHGGLSQQYASEDPALEPGIEEDEALGGFSIPDVHPLATNDPPLDDRGLDWSTAAVVPEGDEIELDLTTDESV